MLLSILGTPSAYTLWAALMLRTLVQETGGAFQYIAVVTFEDLQNAFRSRTNDRVIIYSDSPDAMMTDLLLRLQVPIAVFLEDHADVVGYAMTSRNMDMRDAIRFSCQSYTCLGAFFDAPGVKLFRRDDSMSALEVLKDVAAHFSMPLDDASARRVLARLGADTAGQPDPLVGRQIRAHVPGARAEGEWRPDFSRDDAALIDTVLEPYSSVRSGRTLRRARWPRQLFYDGNDVGRHMSGAIELAGRARFLAWGPYLHLPRGEWSATIHLRVGESFSRNVVVADIKCGEVLAHGRIELPDAGDFIFSLSFEIVDPRLPVEVRLLLEKGAIEGWFEIVNVTIDAVQRSRG